MAIKKLFQVVLVWASLVLALVSAPASAEFGHAGPAANAADGILVQFRVSTPVKRQQSILNLAGGKQVARLGGANSRLAHMQVISGRTLDQTLAILARNPDVEFAEPNYILSIAAIPNDPQFSQLWGMNNTGQTGGVPDADIDAPEAWDIQKGTNVVIAVVDTGVDYNHADLRTNIWSNTREIPGNGIDDDGNGFIDDVRGWDFANNDNNPMDDNRHGTHLAGVIAAQGNNGVGVTGVNWSARIMPVKFMNAAGAGTTATAINGINYAVRNGAKVINASFGGGAFSQAMFNAINAANTAGVLFVAAAGNNGRNNDAVPAYPANYNLPNIISVAATDSADTRAGFSNFGPTTVDLAAPGVAIRSTVPTAIVAAGYASLSGTSMAAPYVSGVAGLVLAQNPALTVAQLKAAILNNVDPIGPLTGVLLTGGRLNAFKAVSNVATPPTPTTLTITPQTAVRATGTALTLSVAGGTGPYTWSSSNTGMTITPATANTATLTSTVAGSTIVTVRDSTNNSASTGSIIFRTVTVNGPAGNVAVGASVTMTAAGGQVPYSWSVSNTAVATINASSGVLTGVSSGSVTVTATDADGITGSAVVTVGAVPPPPPPPATMTIAPNSANVLIGSTRQFTVAGGTAPYIWWVNNISVATIDSNTGLLTGVAAGSVVVTVADANGITASSGPITVSATPPVPLVIAPATAAVAVGATRLFTATGGPAPYTWTSSNPAAATIGATTGVLTGRAVGVTTVTATDATGNTGVSGTITITAGGGMGGMGGGM